MKRLRDIVSVNEAQALSSRKQRALHDRINLKMDLRQMELLGGLTKDRGWKKSDDQKLFNDKYYNRLNHIHGMTHPMKAINKAKSFYNVLRNKK